MRPSDSDVVPPTMDSPAGAGSSGETRTSGGVSGGQPTASTGSLEPSPPPAPHNPTQTLPLTTPQGQILRRPVVTLPKMWGLIICPTTGGNFSVCIPSNDTVDGLKRTLSKRLKIQKDRINLLYKDRLLRDGTLFANNLSDHSRVTILPNVETGLMAQKHDDTVVQALESLTESQVEDFLTGRSPLTLAMRLGEHMMFVQVQLSISPPGAKTSSGSSSVRARNATSPSRVASMSSMARPTRVGHGAGVYGRAGSHWGQKSGTSSLFRTSLGQTAPVSTSTLLNVPPVLTGLPATPGTCPSSPLPGSLPPASPSHPLTPTTLSHSNTSPIPSPTPSPPAVSSQSFPSPQGNPGHPYFFGGNQPVTVSRGTPRQSCPLVTPVPIHPRRQAEAPSAPQPHTAPAPLPHTPQNSTPGYNSPGTFSSPHSTSTHMIKQDHTKNHLSNAKRSLSEKLREFSSQTTPAVTAAGSGTASLHTSSSSSPSSPKQPKLQDKNCTMKGGRLTGPGGAKIESMQHLGQGVFSGTFSGTLNPALQDREGKPKKSISTIIHILNDLLGASPHYQQLGGVGSGAVQRIVGVSSAPPPPVTQPQTRTIITPPKECPVREVSDEMKATRGKMEQIQSMLEQRRRRRQQRRQTRCAPYTTSWSQSADGTNIQLMEQSMNDSRADDQPMDLDDEDIGCEKDEHGILSQSDDLTCSDVLSDKEGADLDTGALAV